MKSKFSKALVAGLCICVTMGLASCGQSAKTEKKYEKIVATSVATTEILDKLEVDNVVGIPESKIYKISDRYKNAKKIGKPMSPDVEVISSLKPDLVLGPKSLEASLKEKYDSAGLKSEFWDLSSVEGLYDSVTKVGKLLGKEKQAEKLVKEYKDKIAKINERAKGKKKPRVLLLMGVPGSYLAATESSYVGNLVKLAGGENVYGDGNGTDFLKANTEDMLQKKPDVILRASHGLPKQVMEMFKKEFATNDIWKHFDAVKNGRVYDLNNDEFGMSASFKYEDALKTLEKFLFPK